MDSEPRSEGAIPPSQRILRDILTEVKRLAPEDIDGVAEASYELDPRLGFDKYNYIEFFRSTKPMREILPNMPLATIGLYFRDDIGEHEVFYKLLQREKEVIIKKNESVFTAEDDRKLVEEVTHLAGLLEEERKRVIESNIDPVLDEIDEEQKLEDQVGLSFVDTAEAEKVLGYLKLLIPKLPNF